MNLFMFPFAHGAYDAQELTDDSEVRQTMFKYHLVSFYNTYFWRENSNSLSIRIHSFFGIPVKVELGC